MSLIGGLYNKAYGYICGKHPNVYPWHFQWLPVKDLYRDLRDVLPSLHGRVLDIGCGTKPYKDWSIYTSYIGVDVEKQPQVDVIIDTNAMLPFSPDVFDSVLCTQVLEHVENFEIVIEGIDRVLKPGGTLIVTLPFIYNEHGIPHDYRRFSVHGVRKLFYQYDISQVKPQGGIGSTLGLLLLNWISHRMNQSKPTRFLFALFLPIWIVFCGIINMIGSCMDKIDTTSTFYSNVLLVAKKR